MAEVNELWVRQCMQIFTQKGQFYLLLIRDYKKNVICYTGA